MDFDPSLSLGPYRLGREIARGALGRVVLAVDTRTGADVALRVLKPALANDTVYLHRLEEQLGRARQIEHPRLARSLEWGPIGDRYVVASAFVPGDPLTAKLEAGPLASDQATTVVHDVADVIASLHAAGLVHQGISPDKVIVGEDGRATLTGAGLVTFGAYSMVTTRFDQVFGNVGYLAPEVIRGNPPGPPSDVYALGCLAFACFAGHPPFDDVFVYEVPLAHLEKEPPRLAEVIPGIDPDLDRLVAATLAKDPSVRPTSVQVAALLAARSA